MVGVPADRALGLKGELGDQYVGGVADVGHLGPVALLDRELDVDVVEEAAASEWPGR